MNKFWFSLSLMSLSISILLARFISFFGLQWIIWFCIPLETIIWWQWHQSYGGIIVSQKEFELKSSILAFSLIGFLCGVII